MPQVYVGRAHWDGADFVPRLAVFDRVHLEAGQSRSVELRLEPRLLARWDDVEGAFRIAGGDYEVRIGAHALDEDGPTQTIKLAPSLLHRHPPNEGPLADEPLVGWARCGSTFDSSGGHKPDRMLRR
ncbi:fibronectin type III-like domain-contianing protein [Streptomyces sp. NPDC088253]|uniref:fibronectin type III-like domain-contianing protein n=1 Tax=Streptomyces sp. NPDC088253 TaxID=3365846 RepID=UPI0038208294